MQYKDAAFEILKRSGEPLHYSEIAERAVSQGLLVPKGATPEATMGALLYTDTLRDDSRFVRDEKRGHFGLKGQQEDTIDRQIEALNRQVRKQILEVLHVMPAKKFEDLIAVLLRAIGLDENSIKVTPFSGDGGVDVRGTMAAGGITDISVAVQAKRWKERVRPNIVRELRGSLKPNEQGIIITTTGFTQGAKDEARADSMKEISLIDGERLVELLIENRAGAGAKQYAVNFIDESWWTSLGVEVSSLHETPPPRGKPAKKEVATTSIRSFPIAIRSIHNGKEHHAELLNVEGHVRMNGQEYQSVTAAAKTITTDWKRVNGWDFWRYCDENTGKWKKISALRNKKKP